MTRMKRIFPDRTRRRLAWRWLAMPLFLAAAGAAPRALAERDAGQAGSARALERRVKAAFLYKFLGYAEFPAQAFAGPDDPLTIAVAGSDAMAAELSRIAAGRLIAGRPIVVRHLSLHEAPPSVHLLFVAGNDAERAGRVLRAVPGAVLTVTECDDGLRLGSVINFRIIDQRVRFDVSLDAADKNGVKLSSRLLTVANRVQKGTS